MGDNTLNIKKLLKSTSEDDKEVDLSGVTPYYTI